MNIAEKLTGFAEPLCGDSTISDVRIGLGYSCVELDNGGMGVAWTPSRSPTGSCTHLSHAGGLLGLAAKESLSWLNSDTMLERAVGLATFNALNSKVSRNFVDDEAISLLKLQAGEHVVMIGHFAPIEQRIKKTGCRLEIIELDPGKPGNLGILNTRQDFSALARCDVAIITATSIINKTIDALLAAMQNSRAAVLLGPSTPLCPEAFAGTRITQFSGAHVLQPGKIKAIVSQGGGTMLMKNFLQFHSVSI
ncbi:MAG: hypothetical protein FD168_1320 [Desulfobulbaceae bacterium]|nr:MAG: hypothetical protein FD168_1320 [Desulfobulbaceae bacterium]